MRLGQALIIVLSGFTFLAGAQSKLLSIEERGLEFLIDVLNDPNLCTNEDLLLPLSFEEDMKFVKLRKYYSSGKLCLISQPEDIFDQSIIGSSRNILNGLNEFRDSLQSHYIPQTIDLPLSVGRMEYKAFLEKGDPHSYFFTVRHHLKSQNVTLVQIHVTPCEKSDNPFEYTFYIYFEGDRIANWNISMTGDFDFDIDC